MLPGIQWKSVKHWGFRDTTHATPACIVAHLQLNCACHSNLACGRACMPTCTQGCCCRLTVPNRTASSRLLMKCGSCWATTSQLTPEALMVALSQSIACRQSMKSHGTQLLDISAKKHGVICPQGSNKGLDIMYPSHVESYHSTHMLHASSASAAIVATRQRCAQLKCLNVTAGLCGVGCSNSARLRRTAPVMRGR